MAEAVASPLYGKRVVITRSALQSHELLEKLSKLGAIPTGLPLVSFAVPENYAPFDSALTQLERFDWVLFTSANAVHAVEARSDTLRRNLLAVGKPSHVAVVGPATEEAAEKAGFSVDYVAKTHLGVALAQELGDRLREQSIFLPRSDHANPDLPAALRRLGAKVTEVVAYRTSPPTDIDKERADRVVSGEADAILFFSPTAVRNFADLVGREQLAMAQHKLIIAAVGPVTSAALRDSGVERMVVASDTTAAAVVEALERHFVDATKHSATGAKHA